jgi:hypothetical protein
MGDILAALTGFCPRVARSQRLSAVAELAMGIHGDALACAVIEFACGYSLSPSLGKLAMARPRASQGFAKSGM